MFFVNVTVIGDPMKFFSFFFCLLTFSAFAASDPDKALKDKIMTRADFETEVDKYYQDFRKFEGVVVETKRLEEQVSIRNSMLSGDFYDVIYRIKPLLAENKSDFQSWYILLNALVDGRNRGFTYEQSEVDYTAYLAMKAANDLQDKYQVIWKRAESTFAADDVKALTAFLKENADEAQLKKRHTELTTLYPQKFAPYKIDRPENQKLASVCLVLTQNLNPNRLFDYKPFITVSPELPDFSVQGRNSNLCVEGFEYGKDYTIKLKKGLTSDLHVDMTADYEFPVYISHRKPNLNFRERGYVLPAKGPQLLPLNTVNLSKAYLHLYRIPARNYATFSAYESFLGTMNYSYDLKYMTGKRAENLWKGRMTTEAAMNQTKTHGIPISALVNKQLEPGLYLLSAEDGDEDDTAKSLLSVQWFLVSDLGVTAYKGEDGIHVFCHELSTAEPVRTEMTLVAHNNKILGKVEADSFGHGHFPAEISRGTEGNRPRYVYVNRGEEDFTFLDIKEAGFDFTDRGAEGRDPAQKWDAYLYAERGIYRPAEEINFTGLVRARGFEVVKGEKLMFKLFSPDGKESVSELLEDQGAGSYSFNYELPKAALQGEWQAKLFHDPKAAPLAICTFEINDYVPPKVDVALSSGSKALLPDNDAVVKIDAKYYYGRKAENLIAKGRADLRKATKPFKTFPEAQFGFEEEEFLPLQFTFPETRTNQEGQAILRKTISTKTDVSAPLTLDIEAGIVENGGRYDQKKISIPYFHKPYYLGIIPDFRDKQASGGKATFKVFAVDAEGIIRPLSNVKYNLLEEEQDFSWYSAGSQVNYEALVKTRVLSQGAVTLNEVKPVDLAFDIGTYGRYRLEVIDPATGLGASFRFSSGWAFGAAPDKPDVLDLHIDKKAYKTDDEIKLKVKAPFEGRVMILGIGPDQIIPIKQTSLSQKGEEFDIDIPRELRTGSGFYLAATAIRPMDAHKNYMTQRAIGMAWISFVKEEVVSSLEITHEKQIKSQSSLDVTLTYDKDMKKPYATIAIVDESLLNLTDFKSPNPLSFFFSQQKLGYQVYDMYGKLINPYGAVLNDSVVGGGMFYGRALPLLPANAFKTLSLFSGVIELESGGTHKMSFDIPDFTGEARLMAVVWDENKMASHASSFLVRDEVVVDLALPRFLGLDDAADVILSFTNTTDVPQNFDVSFGVTGPLQLEDAPQKIALGSKAQENVKLKIFGYGQEGVGTISLTLTDEKKASRTTNYDIAVRSPLADHEKRVAVMLKQGASSTFDSKLINGFDEGLTHASLSVGALPNLGVEAIRKSLLNYAYGCVEQMTSKGYALLTADEIDAKAFSELVTNIIGCQGFGGDFTLWHGVVTPEFWASAFATEFLLRVQDKAKSVPGLYSPQASVELALRNMRNVLQGPASEDMIVDLAYAQYLLVRGSKSSLSQVRFFADNNKRFIKKSKLACAFVGASFALLGDTQLAFDHFNQALVLMSSPGDPFGSVLRDRLVVVTLLAETTEGFPNFLSRVEEVASQVAATEYMSTQEQAWVLRLGHILASQHSDVSLTLNGEEKKAEDATYIELSTDMLKKGAVLENKGDKPVYVMASVSGKLTALPAPLKEAPFTISREIYTVAGAKHEGPLKHGKAYVFVVSGEVLKYEPRHLLVIDRLPAGVEIENKTPELPWLTDATFATYQEARDDRYVASFKPEKEQKNFKFAYLVRAISLGEFSHPATVIENMYRPAERVYGKPQIVKVE